MLGRRRVLVPIAAPPGLPGMLTQPDVVADVLRLMPPGTRMSERLSKLYARFAARTFSLGATVSTSTLPEPHDVSPMIGSVVLPSGTALVNGVRASFALDILGWRPGKKLKNLRTPIMMCVCEHDTVTPPKPTIAYARQAPQAELRVYPSTHFGIYDGAAFERVFADQVVFLQRVVPVHAAVQQLRDAP